MPLAMCGYLNLQCKLSLLLWETVWWLLKKLKIELPYDPAIPLLGSYLKDTKLLPQRESCTSSSLQHHSQQSRFGNNLSVIQKMNYIFDTYEYCSAL